MEPEAVVKDLQHLSRSYSITRLLGHCLVDIRIKRGTGGTIDACDAVSA
jgi:hypothetical protein